MPVGAMPHRPLAPRRSLREAPINWGARGARLPWHGFVADPPRMPCGARLVSCDPVGRFPVRSRSRNRPCADRSRPSTRRSRDRSRWPARRRSRRAMSAADSSSTTCPRRGELRADAGGQCVLERHPIAGEEVEARLVDRLLDIAARGRADSTTNCTCPCACMSPPMTPNDASGRPSRSSMPGMIVWNGRLPGAMQFGCAGSSEKPQPRFCSAMPVSPATMPEPKAQIEAVDQRDDVAVAVGGGEVHGVADAGSDAGGDALQRRVRVGSARRDPARTPCRATRTTGTSRVLGIGDAAAAIGERELHRLDAAGGRRDAAGASVGEVEALEDVERDQRREPLRRSAAARTRRQPR